MEVKDKKARFLSILAIVVTIFGLSLGFAAFSRTLTIKSSAEVNPDESVFNVDFAKNSSGDDVSSITPELNPTGVSGFTATNAVIDNTTSDPVIKNLHATFTEPGQKATYSFYTKNNGDLKAFLKSVTFNKVSGQDKVKVCTAKDSATPSLVNAACEGITLTVTVGDEAFTTSKVRSEFQSATAHDLTKGSSEKIKVVIAYEEGSDEADGGFDVAFGDVVLLYTSNE